MGEDQIYFGLVVDQGEQGGEQGGEQTPTFTAPFYLVGETTDWGYTNDLAFVERNDDLPGGADAQWYLQTTVAAGKDFKVRIGSDGNVWLGRAVVEESCQSLLNGEDNFSFKEAGKYEIFVKQLTAGGYSIYINHVVD